MGSLTLTSTSTQKRDAKHGVKFKTKGSERGHSPPPLSRVFGETRWKPLPTKTNTNRQQRQTNERGQEKSTNLTVGRQEEIGASRE